MDQVFIGSSIAAYAIADFLEEQGIESTLQEPGQFEAAFSAESHDTSRLFVAPEHRAEATRLIRQFQARIGDEADDPATETGSEWEEREDREDRADLAMDPGETLPYWSLSLLEFLGLFVGTLGLILFYWFYRQWQALRSKHGSAFHPIFAALLQLFLIYRLAEAVFKDAEALGYRSALHPAFLTFFAVASSWLSWRMTHELAPLLAICAVLALIPIVFAIRFVQTGSRPTAGEKSVAGGLCAAAVGLYAYVFWAQVAARF